MCAAGLREVLLVGANGAVGRLLFCANVGTGKAYVGNADVLRVANPDVVASWPREAR